MAKALNQISLVLQVPVIKGSYNSNVVYSTRELLNSIRSYYPDAEIVLSI